ncbi:unnamed protein product, partial [marine sediment metagenome]
EPLASLDRGSRRRLAALLNELATGRTILMVSHTPELFQGDATELRFDAGSVHVRAPDGPAAG